MTLFSRWFALSTDERRAAATLHARAPKTPPHAHPEGLAADLLRLAVLAERRRALRTMLGLGASGVLAACGPAGVLDGDGGSEGGLGDGGAGGEAGSCSLIPAETAGPYPGDGTNTANGAPANVLTQAGVVRADLRASFAGLTGTAAGVLLEVELRVRNASGCAPLAGAAVYLWHADQVGRYSLYSAGVTEQNYLRGVQVADAEGVVRFTTVYPGCYDGRMPHLHFEVFASMAAATSGRAALRTSQLAFPNEVSAAVYATSGYEASVPNFGRVSFERDNVFSDGYLAQLASVTGSAASALRASLELGVSA